MGRANQADGALVDLGLARGHRGEILRQGAKARMRGERGILRRVGRPRPPPSARAPRGRRAPRPASRRASCPARAPPTCARRGRSREAGSAPASGPTQAPHRPAPTPQCRRWRARASRPALRDLRRPPWAPRVPFARGPAQGALALALADRHPCGNAERLRSRTFPPPAPARPRVRRSAAAPCARERGSAAALPPSASTGLAPASSAVAAAPDPRPPSTACASARASTARRSR